MIEPLPSSTSSSSAWTLALRIEPAGADDEGLVQDDEAAHERPLGVALAVDPAVEALGGGDDAAVGMAQGDRDRVAAAHEHALHEGLAAIGVARAARGRPAVARGLS